MRVTLLYPLAQHPADTTLTLTRSEGELLVSHRYAVPAADSAHDTPTVDAAPDDAPDADTASLADLKAHADMLGLPTYGTKAQLAERITRATSPDA